MTATDELRRLLDERGAEWEKPTGIIEQIKTVWRDGPWEFAAVDTGDGELSVYVEHRFWLTPAQAVEATLGRGECEIETTENWLPAERYHRCKECGAFFAVLDASHDVPPRYCPNCGRRVVAP
jgi:hypothetical protein